MSKKMVRRGSLTLSALVLALGFSLSGCGADVDDAQSRIQVINAQTLAKQPAGSLGREFERMAKFGQVTPDLWLKHATGAPLSAAPLLRMTEAALKPAQKPAK